MIPSTSDPPSQVSPDWKGEFRRIEQAIAKSDDDGLRARWESGRYMLTLKKGKQLPRGVLRQLTDEFKVSRAELGERMAFAAKFTGDELSTIIETLRTWSAIRKHALRDHLTVGTGPKRIRSTPSNEEKLLARLTALNPEDVADPVDFAERLAAEAARFRSSVQRRVA